MPPKKGGKIFPNRAQPTPEQQQQKDKYFERREDALESAKKDAKIEADAKLYRCVDVTLQGIENERELQLDNQEVYSRANIYGFTPKDINRNYKAEDMMIDYYYEIEKSYIPQGSKEKSNNILIQRHPNGHTFSDGGGKNIPHYHVRPVKNDQMKKQTDGKDINTLQVSGCAEHYWYGPKAVKLAKDRVHKMDHEALLCK